MKNLFLFSLLFFFQSFYGQIDKKDLKKMSYDEIAISFANVEDNFELQNKYAFAYLTKANIEKKDLRIAKAYYMLSLINEYNQSIKYLDSVIKYSKKVEDLKFPMVAYFQKGIKLDYIHKFEEAISNYILTEKYAKKNNNLDYYFEAKLAIAVIKSEDMGDVAEALDLYRECFNFYKKKWNENNNKKYLNTIFSIADAHKSLNQLDSTSYYNKLGYNESIRLKDEELKYLFVLNEGANSFLKENYKSAIDSINKALPFMIKYENKLNELASYYYYGRCYEKQNKAIYAIKNFKKVDSIYKISNYITPEFIYGYHYLINYYKKKGDKENQLYYLNNLMKIDSVFQINYKQLSKKLKRDYDIPNLIKEKETIIKELKNNKMSYYYIITTLFFGILLALFFGIRETRLKKTYKERFETLLSDKSLVKEFSDEKDNKVVIEIQDNNIGISDEIIETVLKELKNFEKNKGYLNSSITIHGLAQEFNTNSKYLSTIVNAKKQKSFVNYVNDLRINYIVNELKNNKNLRKYTMVAIAEEAGFNTSESFSKAFFKRTGIKPSYFVKELESM